MFLRASVTEFWMIPSVFMPIQNTSVERAQKNESDVRGSISMNFWKQE
jgi:hypothetical protein